MSEIFLLLLKPLQSLIVWAARKRVDEAAKTLAVRQAVLRQLVRIHVQEYVLRAHLHADREEGITNRVYQRLENEIDLSSDSPEDLSVRRRIQDEVTIECVPVGVWLRLKLVAEQGSIPVYSAIHVRYRNRHGIEVHEQHAIASAYREDFLFCDALVAVRSHDSSPPQLVFQVTKDAARLMRIALDRAEPEVLELRWFPCSEAIAFPSVSGAVGPIRRDEPN